VALTTRCIAIFLENGASLGELGDAKRFKESVQKGKVGTEDMGQE
jgi:hypothetical protein